MQIRSPELFTKLERLAQHYNNNIASHSLKADIASVTMAQRDWDEVELITARQEVFRHQGYHLDELYLKLLSMARLIKQLRVHLAPRLRTLINNRYGMKPSRDKLMAEMTAANFLPNLASLSDMVSDLFQLTKREDLAQNHGEPRVLATVPEARDIENLLKV